jgi:hypothetical protein
MFHNTDNWVMELDCFQRRGNLLHGWGTLHGDFQAPHLVWLQASNGCKINVSCGKISHIAGGTGINIDIVIYGALSCFAEDIFSLVLEWPDAEQVCLPLPPPQTIKDIGRLTRLMAIPWKHYFTRGMRLVHQGRFEVLLRKVVSIVTSLLDFGWPPDRLIKWARVAGKPLVLVIDHDLGGGANQYRRSLFEKLNAEGFLPLLLTAHLGLLSYQLTVRRGTLVRTAYINDLSTLFTHLANANIRRVVFNNIVSFPEPSQLVVEMARWLRQYKPELFLFLVHDYYSICPVWLLLDNTV